MAVEVDGATHSTDEEIARDAARSAGLAAQGFDALRFTNEEVYRNLDGVLRDDPPKADEIEAGSTLTNLQFEAGATPHPGPPAEAQALVLRPVSSRKAGDPNAKRAHEF